MVSNRLSGFSDFSVAKMVYPENEKKFGFEENKNTIQRRQIQKIIKHRVHDFFSSLSSSSSSK
jgi:hypothetical protein